MVTSAEHVSAKLALARAFYLCLGCYMVAIMTLGFWPSYFALVAGGAAEHPWFVHLHAFVFVGWMGLFVGQAGLVAMGRVAAHRRLGKFGVAWGFLVLVVGSMTTVLSFERRIDLLGFDTAAAFLIWPLLDMIIFAAFFVPAVIYRRRSELHKRFMIVAVTNLLVAAAGRVVDLDTPLNHALNVVLWISPLLLAMAHDSVTRRSVHPVYLAGTLVLVVSSFRDRWADTDAWFAFAEAFAGLVG